MDTVRCRFCKGEIASDAVKCPHCYGWQIRGWLDMQNPKVATVFLIALLVVVAGTALTAALIESRGGGSQLGPEADFGCLEITESSLSGCRWGETNGVVVMGQIKNGSIYRWDDICFHVDVYDSEGRLVDAFSEHDYDIVLGANSVSSFRIMKTAAGDVADYSKHNVAIRWARRMR